jgi:hypothetical protein
MQIHPDMIRPVVAEHVGDLRRDAEKRRMPTARTGRRASGRVSRLADGMTRALSMLVSCPRPRRAAQADGGPEVGVQAN